MKQNFGVIITNRSFFPAHLVTSARKELLEKLHNMGYGAIILDEEDTNLGAVATYEDAKKCAELFNKHRDKISGIIVIMPNFGEETGVSAALDISNLGVPIFVQACSDDLEKLQIENRRDAFCGKISLCNNLYQRGIKFTNTTFHTCKIDSIEFTKDIDYFAGVCRVVNGIKGMRVAAIGARPNLFNTVRFSEKILQSYGISVITADLSEIIFKSKAMPRDKRVEHKIYEIKEYGNIPNYIEEEKIELQAKLAIVFEDFMKEEECQASAIQCWDSIQENYGCATCLAMSMMGEAGYPSACEMDVTGAITMYAMHLASNKPTGYLDWNNNYDNDSDRCINLHCSNFPKSFMEDKDMEIEYLDVLATTIGKEKCFGACKGQVKGSSVTYGKITTDDLNGKIKMYVGEGKILDKKVPTKGGIALCEIDNLQELLKYITNNGFEHHVAMNKSLIADVLEEAFGNYLGVEVYHHR